MENKFHTRTKHIDIWYHYFIREAVDDAKIAVKYISTDENSADIFTKSLTKPKFRHFAKMLGLRLIGGCDIQPPYQLIHHSRDLNGPFRLHDVVLLLFLPTRAGLFRAGHRQPYRAYVRSHMTGPVTVPSNRSKDQLYGRFCTGCVRVREILREFNLCQSNGT